MAALPAAQLPVVEGKACAEHQNAATIRTTLIAVQNIFLKVLCVNCDIVSFERRNWLSSSCHSCASKRCKGNTVSRFVPTCLVKDDYRNPTTSQSRNNLRGQMFALLFASSTGREEISK